jgi:hypothetical protein
MSTTTAPRGYSIGLPVLVTVHPDGKVTFSVDLSEAGDLEIFREDYKDDQEFRDREAQMNADSELINSIVKRTPFFGFTLPEALEEAILDVKGGQILCPENGCQRTVKLAERGYERTWSTAVETDDDGAPILVTTFGGSEDWSYNGDEDYYLVCGDGHESGVPAQIEQGNIDWR